MRFNSADLIALLLQVNTFVSIEFLLELLFERLHRTQFLQDQVQIGLVASSKLRQCRSRRFLGRMLIGLFHVSSEINTCLSKPPH